MDQRPLCWDDVVRHFHPGWFASVMGTGILAVATLHVAAWMHTLRAVSIALWILNTLLCGLLLIPWGMRWVLFPQDAWADLGHPIRGPFYSTMPVGLMVLALNFVAIGRPILGDATATPIAQGLWVAGVITTFLFGVLIPYRWFTSEHIPLDHVHGGWFIPPVAAIVVPATAAPLIPTWGSPELGYAVSLIAFAFTGIGLLLFLIVLALLFMRLVAHPLPHPHLGPTLWIGLGPVGVGSIVLVRLSETALPLMRLGNPEGAWILPLGGLILWGFGVWWLPIAILLLFRYMRETFPFAMSWWAFTFPLGAYTVSTFLLGDVFHAPTLHGIAIALWMLLLCFWAVVFLQTLRGVLNGELLRPPAPGVQRAGS